MARVRRNLVTAALESAVDLDLDLLDIHLDVWRAFIGAGGVDGGDQDDFLTDRQREIRADLESIRQLVRRLSASGIQSQFFQVLHELAANRTRIERAFVVWVDLIEVLVQNAEREFGAQPGQGLLKASQVKASLSYILRQQKFELPQIPPLLRPIVIEMLVGWLIDAVVLACNSYGLWATETQKVRTGWERVKAAILRFFGKIVALLLNGFAHVIVWLWSFRDRTSVLTPRLKEALDAIVREGLILQGDGSAFRHAIGLLEWLGKHRDDAVKTFQMVLEAVQQAESFLSMTGPQKKAYARDLVIAVMAELGYRAQNGLVHAIVVSLVDAGIEVAVHLFNKRGVFAHSV